MYQQSILEDLERSPQKLPKEGMIVDGQLYPLHSLELHTLEKGGSYYPTPTASEGGSNSSGKGKRKPTLSTMARKNLWPTPKAHDHKGAARASEYRRHSPDLPAVAGGKLNPVWVEWLMNYPAGWTELSASVMQWFLSRAKAAFQRLMGIGHHDVSPKLERG